MATPASATCPPRENLLDHWRPRGEAAADETLIAVFRARRRSEKPSTSRAGRERDADVAAVRRRPGSHVAKVAPRGSTVRAGTHFGPPPPPRSPPRQADPGRLRGRAQIKVGRASSSAQGADPRAGTGHRAARRRRFEAETRRPLCVPVDTTRVVATSSRRPVGGRLDVTGGLGDGMMNMSPL